MAFSICSRYHHQTADADPDFLAWIIASFVLIFAFFRRFHDNRGLGPEQLVAWAIRSIIFMVLIGASPFIIEGLTVTGKFFARPIQSL